MRRSTQQSRAEVAEADPDRDRFIDLVRVTSMVVVVVLHWLSIMPILTSKHLQTSLSSSGVLRAVIGAALFLTVVGLLGIGLGALLRNTAGGISTLFGLLFVLPIIVRFLPSSWSDPINKYLPSNAGEAITHVHPDPSLLAPWTGLGLFFGYAVIVLIAAAVSLRRRDA